MKVDNRKDSTHDHTTASSSVSGIVEAKRVLWGAICQRELDQKLCCACFTQELAETIAGREGRKLALTDTLFDLHTSGSFKLLIRSHSYVYHEERSLFLLHDMFLLRMREVVHPPHERALDVH
jgi:hypothetical protein